MRVSHTHVQYEGHSCVDTFIDPLIICYMCEPHTHIMRDYKRFNSYAKLNLLLYVYDSHTHVNGIR